MDTVHPLFASQPTENLTTSAQRWGRLIEASLQHLAQTAWPDGHQLTGNSSTQPYRLGQRSTLNSYMWWVEHDIPPYSEDWCVAYRVQLSLNENGRPVVFVRTGAMVYPVVPLSIAIFEMVMALAAGDPPLITHREVNEKIIMQ
jgi:hypothetical protein